MAASAEPTHFRLRVPHAQLADYKRLYQLLAAPFRRRKARARFFLSLGIGAASGALIALAAVYWNFWGVLEISAGSSEVITLEGFSLCVGVLAVLCIGVGLGWFHWLLTSKRLLSNMYAVSSHEPSDFVLLIGDIGIQTEHEGCTSVITWQSMTDLQEGATASFLFFNRGLNGLVIANEAFGDPSERAACMTFIKSMIARR